MRIFFRFLKRIHLSAAVAALMTLPLSLSASTWLPFGQNSTVVTNAADDGKPTMEFVERGLNRYVIDYSFPGATLTRQTENQTPYYHLSIDQFGNLNNPGRPALPSRLFSFAVPNGRTAVVNVLSSTSSAATGYTVYPAKKPASDKVGAGEPQFEIDADFYNSDVLYPEQPVSICNEIVFRGCTIIRVQLCPVQYNPAQKKLITHSKIRFEVSFIPNDNATSAAAPVSRPTRTSDLLLANIADNAGMIIAQDARTGSAAFDGPTDAVPTPAGGLVIVTTDSYLAAANTLADWKRRMGYNVVVLSQASWTTAAVKSAIRNQYSSMLGGLDYALIFGDHPNVPAETSTLGEYVHVTDLYYGCMDGASDFTPDIGLGRISVASAAEAATVVQKIVTYEKTPVAAAAFYNHATSAAYFQHAGSGYEERRFTLTSWEILQYLSGYYGYTVDREFYTESSVSPLYWNNGYYSNGAAIPAELRRPTYSWDGDAAGISAGINEGRFFIFHRDHGDVTLWGDPSYTVSNINNLTNGNLLPVVFSINCLTGQFDYSGVCFSEAFLRHASGGAVGVFCATQISYSGQNDGLAPGLIDAIWPNPGLVPAFPHNASPSVTPHAPIYNMGMVLTQGKIRMSETWNGGSEPFNYEQYTYELFHYLGDPTMRIWTAAPQTITATHAAAVMIGQATFVISGASCAAGIATLSFNGQIIGACQLSGGSGTMTLDPAPSTTGTAELAITAHNYRPYLQNISVIPGGDALIISAPSSGSLYDQGATVPLAWQTFGSIPNIRIEFSSNNGISYTTITPTTANTNSYSWAAAAVESDQCILRVSDVDGSPAAVSGTFSIHNLSTIAGTVAGTLPAQVNYTGPRSGSITTGANGAFSIGQLLPGSYTLYAENNTYRSNTQAVSVPPDYTSVTLTINYPDLAIAPSNLAMTLSSGASGTRTLTIRNNGTAPLTYSVEPDQVDDGSTAPADRVYPASHFLPPDKNAPDNRIGLPVTEGSGGPDAYGYRWVDSDQPSGIPFVWNDITSTGTLLTSVSGCDDCNQSVSLSFPFNYYGMDYSSMYVSSNGYITFGTGSSTYSNYALPGTSAPAGIVAAFWDDLYPVNSGDIHFKDYGDHAVVQYTGVGNTSSSEPVTFQLQLFADGKIRFYYYTMSGGLIDATVGQQNPAQTDGFTIAYNTAYIKNNFAIEISKKPDWLSVLPETGTVQPGTSVGLTATFDASELAAGTYNANLNIRHNDPDATYPAVIPCALTVGSGNRPPTVIMSVTPTSGTAPLTVAFDASASTDPDGDALTFLWNFGDGSSGTSMTTSHVYTTAGNYIATLTASDGNGATGSATQSIMVTATNRPPTAAMTATPANGTAPLTVAFNGSASTDLDGNTLTYAWIFGDGSSGTGVTASHVYTTAGSYTATLTVNDGNGGTDNETMTITVTPASYTITATAGSGGTISPSGTVSVLQGASPTFTMIPSAGYEISSVLVDGVTVGAVGTYTFASVTASHTISAAFAAITLDTIYHINCGGSAASPYTTDQYFSGGTAYSVTSTVTPPAAANQAPQAVYKTERYGNMTYTFPNLTAGLQYVVRLHFAELYWTAAGKRIFNVSINGTEILTNFDLYALTGARYAAEIMRHTATANSSGQIVITFTGVVDNAKINGIEIIETIQNAAPTIARPASAASNPVTASTTVLSVLGADDNGEANLAYTWELNDVAPAVVNFSGNGTNAAKTTTATFTKAGTYPLIVRVFDGYLSATSTLTVTVDQTLTGIVISPSTASIQTSATQQFTATALDQFGTALTTPPAIAWSASSGSISGSGLYTAGTTAGTATVTATSGSINGSATVTITAPNAAPTIATAATAAPNPVTAATTALSVLGADDNGESNLIYTWATTGTVPAAVTFSANGTNASKANTATFTKAGSYTLQVTVRDQGNLAVTSSVPVTVGQTLTSIAVSPSTASVPTSATRQFTATARDQFGTALITQPAIAWSASSGSISASGLYTAGTAAGTATVTAASGTVAGTASVNVTPVTYTITASAGTGGSISPSGAVAILQGASQTFTIVPSTGYQINSVLVDGASVGAVNSYTFTSVTAAHTISASFFSIALNTVYQINCGGSAASPFTADQYYSGGTAYSVTSTIVTTGVTNPAPQSVYKTERYGAITYTLPGLTAGSPYKVRLHFAELYMTATGKRKFNVAINGTTVLSSYDIYASTGARYKAEVKEFTAVANSSGQIVIGLTNVTDNAKINGIEIIETTTNAAPTIATAATAAPNPVIAATTTLSALGADDNGEANLTYTWATTGTVPAAVTFSANGTNAAKATTATFTKAGSYSFLVTIRDQGNLTVTSSVLVNVNQTLTSIVVSPSTASIQPSATQQFTATARDQFGTALTTQPPTTWNATSGSIDQTGFYTAGTTTGTTTITATSGNINGTATVAITIQNLAPTIATAAAATPNPVIAATTALSVLGADDNGEANLIYTWATTGTVPAAVTFGANGTNAAKTTTATFTKAGSYSILVTVRDQGNLTVTSPVTVLVSQTVTTVTLTPTNATVQTGTTQQFTAAAADQFGSTITSAAIVWSVSGGGTISASGLFTAGATAGGPYTVTATSGSTSGTTQITVAQVQTGFVVYGDQLATGYGNYSWGGTYNLSDASPVKVGTKSLSITYTAGWGGLQLQKNSGTQTHTGFTAYSFWAHGGASGTRQCQFYTRNNAGQESNHVNVDIPAGTWTQITITLSSLGNPADAKTVVLQDRSGNVNVEFNIDQLELK